MEIRVRLHPSLRAQLRKQSRSSHDYRSCLARLRAQVQEIVTRHGPEITCAAVNPLPAPLDEGCAMSAYLSRHGPVLADVDPLGTAVGEEVIRRKAATFRPWRAPKPAALAYNGQRRPLGPNTLRLVVTRH